jgi:predicted phage terminase large subunit-like protein
VIGKQSYARQYLMKPGIEGDVFREEWLRFYNFYGVEPQRAQSAQRIELDSSQRWNDSAQGTGLGAVRFPTREELLQAPIVSYCDPSLGGGETNDYKAIITVATWGGRYWILDVYIRKATILEMIDYQYDLDRRFSRTRHYMENNFWQKLLWDFMPQKAAEYGYSLSIAGIQNVLKKEERILKLQPMFEHGTIWHCVAGKEWNLFKEQLLGFPSAGYDDGPDALSGAIERFREIAKSNRYETIERGSGGYMGMF